MHKDEWESFNLDVVSKFENLRIKILYDSPYALRSLLFYHIIPQFSPKNIFIAVYSDTMQRRLEKTYESMARISPEIAEIIGKAKIIKIGTNASTSFGKLQHSIPMDSEWLKTFMKILEELSDRDLMLFHGFSLLPRIYGESSLKYVLDLFEAIPDGPTIISKSHRSIYDERTNMFINMLYDTILRIEKIEDVGLEEFYKIGVSQSIVMDVRPGFSRFKIDRSGRLIEV
jgi:hypothetical protein